MISASRSYRHPGRPRPMVSGGDVPYLHVVDDDVYSDWESVYRDNVDPLYRLMYARVGNRADAEDLTSEVFTTALRPLRLTSSKGEVRAYLLLTAGTVLAYLTQPAASEPPSDAPARARRILEALPGRYRRILELRFLEACSIKEAAHTMQISVSNAKVLQH